MFGTMPGLTLNIGGSSVVVDVALAVDEVWEGGGAGVEQRMGLCIGERERLVISTCIGEEVLPCLDSGSATAISRESRVCDRRLRGVGLSS